MERLFEDSQLLVINKPAGCITEGPVKNGQASLTDMLSHDLEKEVFACHRLDKDTTGVLVFAKTKLALRALSEQFSKRQVRKTYLAAVEGTWSKSWNRVHTRIRRTAKGSLENSSDGKEAITTFRLLAQWNGRSLIEALPKTGRTHQIRLHCLYQGCLISGDGLYGDRSEDMPPMALHASELRLLHPASGEPLRIGSALPDYWLKVWLKDCPVEI